eukprot:snap_masked-scaffold_5-processed-gene-7.21-mRNA-1 protein AED:1.00 eAED:1.00 QI:0/0/0/0/1/1/2/0/433
MQTREEIFQHMMKTNLYSTLPPVEKNSSTRPHFAFMSSTVLHQAQNKSYKKFRRVLSPMKPYSKKIKKSVSKERVFEKRRADRMFLFHPKRKVSPSNLVKRKKTEYHFEITEAKAMVRAQKRLNPLNHKIQVLRLRQEDKIKAFHRISNTMVTETVEKLALSFFFKYRTKSRLQKEAIMKLVQRLKKIAYYFQSVPFFMWKDFAKRKKMRQEAVASASITRFLRVTAVKVHLDNQVKLIVSSFEITKLIILHAVEYGIEHIMLVNLASRRIVKFIRSLIFRRKFNIKLVYFEKVKKIQILFRQKKAKTIILDLKASRIKESLAAIRIQALYRMVLYRSCFRKLKKKRDVLKNMFSVTPVLAKEAACWKICRNLQLLRGNNFQNILRKAIDDGLTNAKMFQNWKEKKSLIKYPDFFKELLIKSYIHRKDFSFNI